MATPKQACWFVVVEWVWLVLAAGVAIEARAQTPSVVYQTEFEFTEGFDPGFSLVGQGGWVGSDTSGNGLVSGFFDGLGQHAFVGFTPPQAGDAAFVNVWRPLNLNPSAGQSIARFSVRLQIVPSTNGHTDDFRWSVYNSAEARLFTIDFDTAALQINYSLDNPTDFVSAQLGFDTEGFYDLEVWMDFGRNLWTAMANDVVIVNSKPISAAGSALNLADIDAVWAIRDPGKPGDNYMVFDDYTVELANVASIPPRVEQLGFGTNKAFIMRVYGEANLNYAVEATTDGLHWELAQMFKAPAEGTFDFEDADALRTAARFFRVKQVP